LNDLRKTGNVVGSRVLSSTAGSATAPSYSFQAEPTTGLYSAGNNSSIGVSVLGNATAFIGPAVTINPQLRVADNTATLPSYSFFTTGMYCVGNDSV
jgi:hypothetical protein